MPEAFDADQHFLPHMIEADKTKSSWKRLDCQPHEEWVISDLEQLRVLLKSFQPALRFLNVE
jgi:hypothetical protein